METSKYGPSDGRLVRLAALEHRDVASGHAPAAVSGDKLDVTEGNNDTVRTLRLAGRGTRCRVTRDTDVFVVERDRVHRKNRSEQQSKHEAPRIASPRRAGNVTHGRTTVPRIPERGRKPWRRGRRHERARRRRERPTRTRRQSGPRAAGNLSAGGTDYRSWRIRLRARSSRATFRRGSIGCIGAASIRS